MNIVRFSYLFAFVLLAANSTVIAQTGNVQGKVTDEAGKVIPFANITVEGTHLGAAAKANGEYLLSNVPAKSYTLQASAIGYRKQTAEVTVREGVTVTVDFSLPEDVLRLEEVVVTGTHTPRSKLESTVAISTLSPREITQANPRSTTEMLRYIPGFTRVESSGGEVNQNISIRGILGVEYVMFMEDGMPVFPTMHTFFMNADNLFRPDENIQSIEVVRGGNSALFGSNTPGAIINFINKSGGPEIGGVLKASAGTEGLARYDLNLNGPLGENWRFNLGGFYRYDRGVRDPGYPGIRGGQFKANVTRFLENGYVRASLKLIDDRNQFILPLPFQNPDNPKYVKGFSDYGAMTSNEGNNVRVPIPTGELQLPLEDGLRTDAYWLTADVHLNFEDGWSVQNTAQLMNNKQGWNAIVPFDVVPFGDWVSGQGLPTGSTYRLEYVNHFDARGKRLPFDPNYNGLVAPGGLWHVEKPISAFQNQFQLRKKFDEHTVSLGLYFANYTQTNRWYFTEILTDVRDNPRFLDLVVFTPTDTINWTRNGFRRYLSFYVNGTGSTTIFSGVLGGEFQLMDDLRADIGFRYELNDFVQTVDNTSDIDLDGDAATRYDRVHWSNGSFRHFDRRMTDWAGSVGLNYALTEGISIYVQGSRAFKMPALDEFLFAQAQQQVELYEARTTLMIEGGVKYSSPMVGFAVNGFWGELKNIIGQGAETNPATGEIEWKLRASPKNRAFGAEVEFSASPVPELSLLGSGTFIGAQTVPATGASVTAGGIPSVLGNLSATYKVSDLTFLADWHYVGKRDMRTFDYDFETKTISNEKKVGELKTYHYLNLGASYTFPAQGITLSGSVLNVYQSKGFEEGNPRLPAAGGKDVFLARPILPRRAMVTISYQF